MLLEYLKLEVVDRKFRGTNFIYTLKTMNNQLIPVFVHSHHEHQHKIKDKFGMYAPIVAKGAKTGDALLRGIMGLGYGASGLVGDITGNKLLARDLAGMFESAGGRLGSPGSVLTAPYRAGTTLGKAKVKQVADDIASDIKYAPEIIKGEASSVALGANLSNPIS